MDIEDVIAIVGGDLLAPTLIADQPPKKTIVVPGKLVNIVV